ncbi:hypothetical protein V6N13_080736 [Hibiscus sabdariffa]|uniref:Uncharacterized protein n=1 Tax=Hibiscus sabdariffa TaxID=183260 RepID=A0ABR2NRZ3_9ROSI
MLHVFSNKLQTSRHPRSSYTFEFHSIPVIKLTQNDDLSCHEPNTFEVRVVILVQHQPCSGSRVRCKGFLDLLSFDYAFRPPTSPDSDSPIRFWIQQLKSEQKLEVLVQSF